MELKDAIVGTWVLYVPKGQVGRIKSCNQTFIFVVFHCDNNWDNFHDYTAAATKPEELRILNKQ